MSEALTGHDLNVDADGHLTRIEDWTPEIAALLAARDGLALTDRHVAILQAAREFHARYQRVPATRALLKHLGQSLGPEYADSILMMQLFGGGAIARTVARLAGLPKPPNCL